MDLTSNRLFSPLFVPDAMQEAVSERAWLQAMLDVEGALAAAQARAGLIPSGAATAIRDACEARRFDAEALGREARKSGNAVVPLVRALTAQVPDHAKPHIHRGATSQDVLDTASMLIARRALDVALDDLDGVSAACAQLAEAHRRTVMPGRTLLQQALPITFALKAAGWLVGVLEARALLRARRSELVVELGGAVGSLAALGDRGITVLGYLAEELGLGEPVVTWHTARGRIANLGSSLGIASGALAKIALDVALMSQTEVAEVMEPAEGGRGGSSTMPHKRNPVGATLALACVRRVHSAGGLLMAATIQEHERAAGAWHTEWEALSEALALTGGAAAWMRDVLEGLEVHPQRMQSNLGLTGGLLLAERVAMLLAERMGRVEAHELVEEACKRAVRKGGSLRDELLAEERVAKELTPHEIEGALNPASYLGSADAFVDRALALYRAR